MTDFIDALKNTETIESENGATMFKHSKSALVDLNFKVPELRRLAISGDSAKIWAYFADAYAESPIYAMKWLLFLRDIRGGLGERNSYRSLLVELCKHNVELAMKLFNLNLEQYGRFDDIIAIYSQVNQGVKGIIINKIGNQLTEDLALMKEGKTISLLAKWMPSINASSANTRKLGSIMAKELGMSPKQYRKTLAALRKYLNVVEVNLSAKEYEKINYEQVPAKANILYKEAFMRHDEERRNAYLSAIKNGTAKINASAMFMHDIVGSYVKDWGFYSNNDIKVDETLEAMWKAQPKFDTFQNTLVVRDGSGSMTTELLKSKTTILDVATAITVYCCENNTGKFANNFITFSNSPQVISLAGCNTLADKLMRIYKEDEYSNTDIEATFDLVLNTAIKNHMSQSDLPKTILVISDMEFDMATDIYDGDTLFDTINKKFVKNNYQMPKLVFWNVGSTTGVIPVQENNNGVILVSGFSKSILDMVCSSELDPYKALISILDSERYDCINE